MVEFYRTFFCEIFLKQTSCENLHHAYRQSMFCAEYLVTPFSSLHKLQSTYWWPLCWHFHQVSEEATIAGLISTTQWDLLIAQFSFPKTNSKFLIAQCILFFSSYIQPHLLVCMCHRKGFTSLQVSFVSPIVVNWWTFSSRKGETWFLGSEPVTADFRAVTIMWNKFFEIFRVHILKAECTTLKKERDCLNTAY